MPEVLALGGALEAARGAGPKPRGGALGPRGAPEPPGKARAP